MACPHFILYAIDCKVSLIFLKHKRSIVLGFEYFRRYKELAACLLTNNLGWYIRDAVIRSELGLSLVSESDRQSRYLFIAYANTLFGIMSEWVISGMKDDPELLARMICDIYQDKLRRY